ncbi:MAG: xanthine dehydrogenase family protein molybdopterin-binding subunit [Nitrospirae bacterium]|nr:MAG: xanthine dehydrogenase family protein molybdopterin-binding subunit [Nitrospirota bacterium]
MTRREFLIKSMEMAGLTVAVLNGRLLSAKEVIDCELMPDVWLQLRGDNNVTVFVAKSEMGQGVYTSLPMIVADEMEADWKRVRFKPAPASPKYIDPLWNKQITGGSTSIRHMYEPLRRAGAAAREMLITAASQLWGVKPSECTASLGKVIHKKSGRSTTYGKLCYIASQLPVPKHPPLKDEKAFRYIGKSIKRLDIEDKVNGRAKFGTDIFLPNMLYASIVRPPSYGARVLSYDRDKIRELKGVYGIVELPSGIAVCAETIESAHKAKEVLRVKWDRGENYDLDDKVIERLYSKHLYKDGVVALNKGSVDDAMAVASVRVEAAYMLPYLAHVTMEPMNCTAHVTESSCDIWIPTQNQTDVLNEAAKITGLKKEKINVNTTYLGGGFGRRVEVDVAKEAILLSRATGRPVKLIWSREEDMKNDFYRPANYSKIIGGTDKEGRIIAWSHKIVAPSIFSRVYTEMMKNGIDPAAVDGIVNKGYEIPNMRVEYVKIDLPIPVGFWRSVGHSHNAFTFESFIDELAHASNRDPLEFRLTHLKENKRAARVLSMAAEKANWGRGKGGLGIAWHFSFGSHVAHVAEVSVDKELKVKVHKFISVIDCGTVINPDTIEAQMESGIIMGLSAALKERISVEHGGIKSSNFNDYPILTMEEAPEIEVYIVKSNEKVGGVGEPPLPPVAPAVANAIFSLTGIRVRQLPMTHIGIRKAM